MKHSLNFKRGAAVLSAIAMAVSVSAQTENYVPKHEFSISGFGGLSTLLYKVDVPKEANDYNVKDVDRKFGFGGGLGLDWTYHFDKHWGIRLGLQGALYTSKAETDFKYAASGIEKYIYLPNQTAITGFSGSFSEQQRAVYAQVPLMVQWMTPVGKHNFYAALGGKFGMRLWDNYKQHANIIDVNTFIPGNTTIAPAGPHSRAANDGSDGTAGFDESVDNGTGPVDNGTGPENPASYFGSNGANGETTRGDIRLKRFDVMGSAELGMRWTLGNGVGLYTGIYFDYGFLNTAPEAVKIESLQDFDRSSLLATEFVNKTSQIALPSQNTQTREPQTTANTTSTRLVDKVNKMAGGLVLRLSFGKGLPVVAPCPECPIVEPIEKIKEIITHDTVRIVKEIPQEIKDKMKDLSNALFAFDKFDINPKAQSILDDVAGWLKKNPQMKCELSGHTDGKGSVDYNQKLSEQRAKAVYDYLIERGVNAANLSWKGYGKSEPIATNATDEGRQLNRRVELRLVR